MVHRHVNAVPCTMFSNNFITIQVHNLTTPYIMKCDDDTFIRVDVVLKEIKRVSQEKPLYMGNLNLLHRPLRHGKWAVSYEV